MTPLKSYLETEAGCDRCFTRDGILSALVLINQTEVLCPKCGLTVKISPENKGLYFNTEDDWERKKKPGDLQEFCDSAKTTPTNLNRRKLLARLLAVFCVTMAFNCSVVILQGFNVFWFHLDDQALKMVKYAIVAPPLALLTIIVREVFKKNAK